jgi:hypothetical protein
MHSSERRQILDPEEIRRERRQSHDGSCAGGCQGSPPTLYLESGRATRVGHLWTGCSAET